MDHTTWANGNVLKDTEPGTTRASKEAATAVAGTKIYNRARELKSTRMEWSTEDIL